MVNRLGMSHFSSCIVSRMLKDDGWKYYLWPAFYGLLFTSVFFLLLNEINVLTSLSEKSLNDTNKFLFNEHYKVHEVFLLVHGGFFLAIISSLTAFNATITILRNEFESGAFEIYLSSSFSVPQVVFGYIIAVIKLVLRQYLVLMLVAILPCYLMLGFERIDSIYILVDIAFPFVSAIYVASMVCFLCFYSPKFLINTMGFKGNFLRFVSLAPSTFTLIAITTLQPAMFFKVFWGSLIGVVLVIGLVLFLLHKTFDVFSVITSY